MTARSRLGSLRPGALAHAPWAAIAVVSLLLAGWNLVQSRRLAQDAARQAEAARLVRRNALSQASTHQMQLAVAYRLAGTRLAWPPGLELVNEAGPTPGRPGPSLVIYVNQRGCDVCVQEELRFAGEISAAVGAGRVRAVIAASERRHVGALVRINELRFPTFSDPDNRFATANDLKTSPTVLLVGADGTIVAAHVPVPGSPQFSLAFHSACRRRLGVPEADAMSGDR